MMNTVSIVAASVEVEGFEIFAPLVIPVLVIVAVYMLIYRYYRNTDKRFKFEHETVVEVENLQAYDRKVGTNNGTKKRRISGDNSDDHLHRIRGLG